MTNQKTTEEKVKQWAEKLENTDCLFYGELEKLQIY